MKLGGITLFMNVRRIMAFLGATLIAISILYNIYDNNRISITRQTIRLERLPESFDGFTILQISDLHSKRFGKGQKRLLSKINGCQYDLVVLTGDMINFRNTDMTPFFELLEGLKKTTKVIFVKGNTDPADYDFFTGEKTEFGFQLEERGVVLLNQPYPISKGNDTLWFTSFQFFARINHMLEQAQTELADTDNEKDVNYLKKKERYWKEVKRFWQEVDSSTVKIAVTHYPVNYRMLEKADGNNMPDYDLIIAGHYHGGQIRIPFYGALYVPDSVKGWFPLQSRVSGLSDYGFCKQYISRGLGASDRIPALSFRLFNTPEINLITLKKA